jgi:DNA polymerase III subunit delta
MADKSYEDVLRDLKNKIYRPVYFFHGEESYYIDMLTDYIDQHVLEPSEKEFNQTVVYGRDTDTLSLLSIAKRYPMMSNYSVVIVREAHDMKYFSGKEKGDNDPLLNYVLNPLSSTLLVFCYKYKSLDKRSKLYKALDKHAVIFESKKVYDSKVPEWVHGYMHERGYRIAPQASLLIAEYLGNDLSKVANECDKLLLNVPKGKEIDNSLVERNIGISKDFNVFELNTALAKKHSLRAFRIAAHFRANPKMNPFVVTIATLYTFFSKVLLYHSLPDQSKAKAAAALGVNPFFISEYETAAANYPLSKVIHIIGLLREYDLKSKGIENISVHEGDLLRELIYKILN